MKINRELHYPWRGDHGGEVLACFASKTLDMAAALRFIKKALKRPGKIKVVTDGLRCTEPTLLKRGSDVGGHARRDSQRNDPLPN